MEGEAILSLCVAHKEDKMCTESLTAVCERHTILMQGTTPNYSKYDSDLYIESYSMETGLLAHLVPGDKDAPI